MGRTIIDPGVLKSLEHKFWPHIIKIDTGCWLWGKYINRDGYGEFKFCHSKVKFDILASRVSYFYKTGIYDKSLVVRHTCDTPACVNPEHLIHGTQFDNIQDRVARKRSAVGSKNGRSKLSEDDVRFIRASNDTNRALASKFLVDRKVIYDIKHYNTWKSIV